MAGEGSVRGHIHHYGDHVNTDDIIPSAACKTLDPVIIRARTMEHIDPEFPSRVRPGDVVVAGRNFGGGSAREHAPLSLKLSGISCAIAKSFGRSFYRNSINIGFPILECAEADQLGDSGEELEVDLRAGTISQPSTGRTFQTHPLPDFVMNIINAGGLIPFWQSRQRSS